jgi:hypothetical protein
VEGGETFTRSSTRITSLRLRGFRISLEVEEEEGIGIMEVGGEN